MRIIHIGTFPDSKCSRLGVFSFGNLTGSVFPGVGMLKGCNCRRWEVFTLENVWDGNFSGGDMSGEGND